MVITCETILNPTSTGTFGDFKITIYNSGNTQLGYYGPYKLSSILSPFLLLDWVTNTITVNIFKITMDQSDVSPNTQGPGTIDFTVSSPLKSTDYIEFTFTEATAVVPLVQRFGITISGGSMIPESYYESANKIVIIIKGTIAANTRITIYLNDLQSGASMKPETVSIKTYRSYNS